MDAVETLKRRWVERPDFDLEGTPGFSGNWDELERFSRRMLASWARERDEERRRANSGLVAEGRP